MQLFSRKMALVAVSLGALTALGACGDDVTVTPAPAAPVVISITPSNATINIGESLNLAVQITGGSTTSAPTLASCTSSNTAVATAAVQGSACRVTAVTSGNVTITAAASTGNAAAAGITVAPAAAAISNLTTSPTSSALAVGQSVTIVPNVVKAAASVTTTPTYSTSSSAIATVTAGGVVTAVAPGTATITVSVAGSGTGFTTTTLTAGVTITVSPAPPAIAGLTVSPTALGLPIGTTGQIVASTQAAAGVTPTITYSSSTPTVASVSGAGLVTALTAGTTQITVTASAPGTATLSASTLTATVAVTVSPQAVVSITSVTQGPTVSSYSVGNSTGDGLVMAANGQVNQPVDITNTRDQIQLAVNLTTNGQRVDSAVVFIADAAGANRRAAARQLFAGGQASSGTIGFLVNTADFTVASGAATILYPNGQRIVSVSVFTTNASGVAQEIQSAANNRQTLNFNNVDSWAIIATAPSRVAQGGRTNNTDATATRANFNWWGGPGAAGDGSFTIVPVFYTPGRTVQTVNTTMGVANGVIASGAAGATIGTAICGASINFTSASALPWTTTYGSSTAAAARQNCAGYEHPNVDTRNVPAITSAVDNFNNPAPIVTLATGYRTSTTVSLPTPLRLDYAAPSLSVTAPATQWASGVLASPYSFATNSAATDNGVGVTTTFNRSFSYFGCGIASGSAVAMTSNTAADIPECATDFTQNVYRVIVAGSDILGNANTAQSGLFAIDNIAPVIRYSVGTNSTPATPATPGAGTGSWADTTTFSASTTTGLGFAVTALPVAGDSIFAADALDERSGLTTASQLLARANQANNTGVCQRGTGTIGAAFITAPGCTLAGIGAPFSNANVDGYRRVLGQVYGSDIGIGVVTEGYYSYQVRVGDRAGNFSTLPIRKVLFNTSTPAMTGLGIPSTVTAAGPNVFTPNFTELVEGWVSNLAIGYGSGNALQDPTAATRADLLYPATLMNARFNDAILLNGNYSAGTPFSSGVNVYTNIEYASTAGAINNAAASRPDSAYSRVINVGGNPSAFFGVQLLSGNVANDATNWSSFNGNLQSWTLGTIATAWNAPANGVKALVTANTNQINSPFTRVDFYEYQTAAPLTVIGAAVAQWVYIGSVDGTATPCVSASATCPVYIADNGVTRVWTYRLTTRTNGVNGLAAGSVLTSLASGGAQRFMAVASNGTKGRVLATNPATAVSQLPTTP